MSDVAVPAPVRPKVVRERMAGGRLVPVGDLLNETVAEFTENMGPYVMVGLAQMLVAVPVVLFAVIAMYVLMIVGFMLMMVGMIASIAVLPEELGAMGAVIVEVLGLFGTFGLMFAIAGGIAVVLAPFSAGVSRAIAAHQRGEGPPLTLASPFATMSQDAGRVIGTALAYTALITLGLMFCYLPAILVVFFFGFANTLTALHGLRPTAALAKSFAHARDNLGWYVPFVAVWIGVSMVAAYVPVLGPAFLLALHVRAHRNLFGDEPAAA